MRALNTILANKFRSASVQKPVAAIRFMGDFVCGEPGHHLFRYVAVRGMHVEMRSHRQH